MDMNLSKFQEIEEDREPGMLPSMGSQRVRHDSVTERRQPVPNNWFNEVLPLKYRACDW